MSSFGPQPFLLKDPGDQLRAGDDDVFDIWYCDFVWPHIVFAFVFFVNAVNV